jgi:HD-GYP domain-containing protein (c-di-GMP phosphodiesterase class II)
MSDADETGLRVAEVIAALSLATDLGMGQPMEHMLRTCLLAVRLGSSMGLSDHALSELYYIALLRRIGCTSDAYELGVLFGDDLAAHARSFTLDFGRPLDVLADMLRYAGAGQPPWDRAGAIVAALAAGRRVPEALFRASCEVARSLAAHLGFGPRVQEALGQTFERCDGQGFPHRLRGEETALPARIVQVAEDAEVFHRLGGVGAVVAMARQRAGAGHDPAIAARLCQDTGQLFQDLEAASVWEAALAAEPRPHHLLSPARLDAALEAIAWFADLKSPFTTGHSTRVAELAARAAVRAGLSEADAILVRRAGLVHDLGRAGVPNRIWDKRGPLIPSEWELVRLHPYYTERALSRPAVLARLGALAGLHHERLDGSGYYRGVSASMLAPGARILAAADVYSAMTEPRPHRPALAPEVAARELRDEVRRGRLDGEAVNAVLQAAGHRVRRQRAWPAGLSGREVEVLRLVARGFSNRQIARRLVIAEPTVAHHIQHLYAKIGVSTRAAATLFALQHALLEPVEELADRAEI